MSGKTFQALALSTVFAVTASFAARLDAQSGNAQAPQASKTMPVAASSATNAKYDDLFEQYLAEARKMPVSGALWMNNLMADPRARSLNDLLTIRIEENVTASGSADSKIGKTSSAKVTIPSPLSKGLDKLVPNSADTQFAGSGATSRSSAITALLTARVKEVLPNGDLVIEGIREVDVNGDNQVVVLTGVVRPVDVAQNNLVSSTLVGQLRIRSIGRGLIKDSLSPGWLMRILNKIF